MTYRLASIVKTKEENLGIFVSQTYNFERVRKGWCKCPSRYTGNDDIPSCARMSCMCVSYRPLRYLNYLKRGI